MSKKRSQEKRAKPLAPPAEMTELQRCHHRWRHLWQAVLRRLEAQEPAAYRRLMFALKRHGLAEVGLRDFGLSDPPKPAERFKRPVMVPSPPRPVPELEAEIPSVLAKLAAFCADDSRTVLRGKARLRLPLELVLELYEGARWHATTPAGRKARLPRETRQAYAYRRLSEQFGYRSDDAWKKYLQLARRETRRKYGGPLIFPDGLAWSEFAQLAPYTRMRAVDWPRE